MGEKDELVFKVTDDVVVITPKNDFIFYLKGVQIDFQRQGLNAVFKYLNPNEKGSCGCGESFTT